MDIERRCRISFDEAAGRSGALQPRRNYCRRNSSAAKRSSCLALHDGSPFSVGVTGSLTQAHYIS
ncbi:hypothetical protein LINPERPRIM_LOCUS22949 [Linum perenne]